MSVMRSLLDELEQLRDELRVQINLAGKDAQDEWEKLEDRWSKFSSEARLEESGENLADALKEVGNELKTGYQNLRNAFRS